MRLSVSFVFFLPIKCMHLLLGNMHALKCTFGAFWSSKICIFFKIIFANIFKTLVKMLHAFISARFYIIVSNSWTLKYLFLSFFFKLGLLLFLPFLNKWTHLKLLLFFSFFRLLFFCFIFCFFLACIFSFFFSFFLFSFFSFFLFLFATSPFLLCSFLLFFSSWRHSEGLESAGSQDNQFSFVRTISR